MGASEGFQGSPRTLAGCSSGHGKGRLPEAGRRPFCGTRGETWRPRGRLPCYLTTSFTIALVPPL